MPRIDDIRMPGGMSMNLDVDLSLLPENAYREAYNMRNGSSASNNLGGMEALKGNTLRWELSQLLQQTRIIGRYVDPASNSIFLFATTTPPLTGHFIMRYYYDTGDNQLIFSDPILNFSLSYPVNHIDFVDGKILYWTDGYNPPRKLNVDKAYNYTNNVNVSALDRYFKNVVRSDSRVISILDQIMHPPLYSPTKFTGTHSGIIFVDGYGNDTSKNLNLIKNNLWQFRYRYVYDDYSKSVWSPCSKAYFDNITELANGITHKNQSINNVIGLVINTGREEVNYIEIATRTDKTGKWRLIDRINKYDTDGGVLIGSEIDYTYIFYNNVRGEDLDQFEVNRDFHLVPKVSKAMAIIEKNRLVHANIKEGMDSVLPDVRLSLKYNKKYGDQFYADIPTVPVSGNLWEQKFRIDLPSQAYLNGVYSVIINRIGSDDNWIAQVICEEGDTPLSMKIKMMEALDNLDYITYNNLSIRVTIISETIIGLPYSFIINVTSLPISPGFKVSCSGNIYLKEYNYLSFKAGCWQEFALRYFDRGGRACSVTTDDSCKIFIPYYPTLVKENAITNRPMYQILIDWEIFHKPPIDAVTCRWYRKNSSIEYFLDTYLPDINIKIVGELGYLIIDPLIGETVRVWKNCILENYIWSQGDRIRFYGYLDIKENKSYYFDKEYDFELVGVDYSAFDTVDNGYLKDDKDDFIYDEFGNKKRDKSKQSLIIHFVELPFPKYEDAAYTYYVEIYRPRSVAIEENQFWYEFSEEIQIINPGTEQRTHGKGYDDGTRWARDQGYKRSARGTFSSGDIYLKVRNMLDFAFPVETSMFSDFYLSNLNDNGKVSVINKEYRERWFPTTLRYGGLYIQESYVNELTAIIGGDLEVLSEKYGEITLLKESGYTLKVRCANKIVSLYIGRAGLQQAEVAAEGGEVVVASDRILGTQWITNQIYGCIRPESDVTHGNDSYFVDIYNGHIIRESKNGLLSLSNAYGLRDWTKTVCEYLITYCDNIRIVGGYNESHGELWYTFYGTRKTDGSVYQQTLIMFDPETSDAKGFKSFVEYTDSQGYPPDIYAAAGMRFFVTLKGALYEQDTNDLRCNFFGIQRYPSILLVFNKQVNMEKVFKVLQYDGEQEWHCPTAGDIKVPASYGQREMMSILDIQRIKNIKGIKYGYFGRNMLTTTDKPSDLDLMNGEELRGRLLLINLVGRNPNKSILRWVKVESVISMLTG